MKPIEDKCIPKNFWEEYSQEIKPALMKIDIAIKEQSEYISPRRAAKLLNITENEVKSIMKSIHIDKITSFNFFNIMLNSTSRISSLISREIETGVLSDYTPFDISYIYGLDENDVLNAFNFLGLEKINASLLKAVFIQIPVKN